MVAAGGLLTFLVLWLHAGVRINAYRLATPAEEAEIRAGALIHYSRAELHDLVDDSGMVHLEPSRCRQRSRMWLAHGLRASRRPASYVLRDGSAAAHVWGNLGPRPPATVLRLSGADLSDGPLYIRDRDGAIGLRDGYRGRQLT